MVAKEDVWPKLRFEKSFKKQQLEEVIKPLREALKELSNLSKSIRHIFR